MSSRVLDVVGQMEVKPEDEPQISNTLSYVMCL